MDHRNREAQVLFIEPFYGGSHKVLIDALTESLKNYTLVTLPAKKWHWKARCSALSLFQKIPKITTEKVLFCSSVLNLCELLGLRSDLQKLKKIVYFHENQLVYPVQEIKARDVQFAYNQITTCLAADIVIFNSEFNRNSFIKNVKKIVNFLPSADKPKNLETLIEKKSQVLYFPVNFDEITSCKRNSNKSILHIAWPHRWEFDKGPEDFFQVLLKLKQEKLDFRVSILGESFSDNPEIFAQAAIELKQEIINYGFLKNKQDYYSALSDCHLVVSTAKHEFFGVSMLEGAYCGCFPLAPNDLVYPEIFPAQCLYKNLDELYAILRELCVDLNLLKARRKDLDINFRKYGKEVLICKYLQVMEIN